MPQTISPYDILTSSNKYPEREKSDECTTQVRINAADLAERVSRLLDLLGANPRVSSGFRTIQTNAKSKGAKASSHLTGEAVDLEDTSGTLATNIMRNLHLLEQCGLYMESPQHTKGWVHLTTRSPRSGNRVFIP